MSTAEQCSYKLLLNLHKDSIKFNPNPHPILFGRSKILSGSGDLKQTKGRAMYSQVQPLQVGEAEYKVQPGTKWIKIDKSG